MSRLPAGLLLVLTLLSPGATRAQVVINEIMYNSAHAQDVEYVELVNAGETPRSLDGWTLIDDDNGHTPCSLAGTLAPGEFLVVAGDLALFQSTYPGVNNVNPNPFTPAGGGFALGNGSDVVRLFDDQAVLVDSVAYTDSAPWPPAPDGDGPSLELKNPSLDNSLATSWSVSGVGGSPGVQNDSFTADVPPVIGNVTRNIPLPGAGQTVTVTATVTDDQAVSGMTLSVDTGSGFSAAPMYDDGLHGDGPAGNLRFGAFVAGRPSGTLVRYFVTATDSSAQQSVSPAGAPTEYLAYTVDHVLPPLRINELLASNQNGIRDEAQQRDDWLEIRNAGPLAVDLTGMFLSEDLSQPRMWPIPSSTLPAGGRLLVWCDNQAQGPFHANFALAAAGGEVWLFDTIDHGNQLIHGMTFGVQSPDRSFGYRPEDGDAPDYLSTPTPVASNDSSALLSPVCINEFLTASSVGIPDWVELYNRSDSTVDISGWSLADHVEVPTKYTFPAGTLLAPGALLSVTSTTLGFGLDNNGSELLMLTRAAGTIGQDYLDYGPQFFDVSQGRFPDGTANWHFFSNTSRDLPNGCDQGVPPLAAVSNLSFESPAGLAWDALDGATGYDVVRGDLGLLLASAGDFAATGVSCIENNGQDLRGWDASAPAPGAGVFYLVRATTASCGFGTYDSTGPAQQGFRDSEIAAGAACP